jgi:hypothetical protein
MTKDPFTRNTEVALIIAFVSFLLIGLYGCMTPPRAETPEQLYAQEAIYISDAAQAVIDAQLANLITGVQAATMKRTLQQALEALKAARKLTAAGNEKKADAQLKLAKALLLEVRVLLPNVPAPPSASYLERSVTL